MDDRQQREVGQRVFSRVTASNGTLNDGYLGLPMEKSTTSTKETKEEPYYNSIKSKTLTLYVVS